MNPVLRRLLDACLLVALGAVCLPVRIVVAAPTAIESVAATFHSGSDAELREAIDGSDVGTHGWSVAPQTDRPQSAVFRLREPLDAAAMDVTLCFLSGRPNSFVGEFALSATTEAQPSLQSRWVQVTPLRFNAAGLELTLREDDHFVAEGSAGDAIFQLTVRAGELPITGFRLDVFPCRLVKGQNRSLLSARSDGDFTLTEFRVEASGERTTNIALGRPVSVSHPARFAADTLTDGLPGTFTHPLKADVGGAFFFEIDLGAVHKLDHIVLRNRGDGAQPDRLSRITLALYEEPPASAEPAWKGRDRDDGSHPGVGAVDVIRASDGAGRFSGRWLRVSSDSPTAFSPQLAEVEVYEELGLQLAELLADGVSLPLTTPVRIPPGTRRLAATMKLAHGVQAETPCRWRLRGYHTDWQSASALTGQGACPPPGDYVFEAQVRHTDREWDSEVLTIPVEARAYFWQTRAFRRLAPVLASLAMAGAALRAARVRMARRMAALESNAALATERARIARDMHDEVGAQLSQLAILQEIVGREHPLPDAARQSMRQLAQATRRVIASLDEVVWAVNPKNDTLPSLAAYLEHCASAYLGPVEIACRFDTPLEWPAIEVRAQVRHNLVLAFREALQNVLKHSGASEVTLKLRLESARFTVVLADNGRGLPEERDGVGKDGLANMSARLAAIDGVCQIRPRAGGGAEVEMCVPLQQGLSASHS